MRLSPAGVGISLCLAMSLALGAFAQSSRSQRGVAPEKKSKESLPKDAPTKKPSPSDAKDEPPTETEDVEDQQDPNEVVKVETDLVTVPVIASDREDAYVPDLRQEELSVYEDGVKQELVFFATTSAPFDVVLMLDTSASTQEKLRRIQSAAVAFVDQLQTGDRVKVISFDDKVRDLCDFTEDRSVLSAAINRTLPGRGTKLYDAMELALNSFRRAPKKRRKAVVIFTDGVDWHSDRVRYDDNVRQLEESGVIVYPIRYDTRADTERLARQQSEQGQRVDLGTIFGSGSRRTTPTTVPGETETLPEGSDTSTRRSGTTPRGTTPTTVPGGSIPFPDAGRGGTSLPSPSVILTPRRRDDPSQRPGGDDPTSDPNARGGSRGADRRFPRDTGSRPPEDDPFGGTRGGRTDDSIKGMLDLAYLTADGYLDELALKSGGELYRADTLFSLPEAFERIAAELRTQYSLGYYPLNRERDGKYRKIQVKTTRKDVVIRARPGYRAPREVKK